MQIAVILTTLFMSLFVYFFILRRVCIFIMWDIEPIHPLKLMTNMSFVDSAKGLRTFLFQPQDLFTARKIEVQKSCAVNVLDRG